MKRSEPSASDLIQKARRDRDPSLAKLAAKKFEEEGDMPKRTACLFFLGELRFSAGAIKEAATHFIECRESYRELDLRKEEAQCLLKLSRCSAFLRNEPDFSSEQTFLDEALVLAKDTGEKGLEVECLVLLGASLRHEQADLAMSKYAEALKLIEAEKNNWLSGICHQSLGHLYAGQTDNWTARKHYLQALSHFEECSAEDATLLAQKQAQCCESIGDLALREGDEDEAKDRYVEAAEKLQGKPTSTQRLVDKIQQLSDS